MPPDPHMPAFIRARSRLLLPVLLIGLTGCGYIGDPLPPSLQIPRAVQDLTAVERGETVFIEFTTPPETTDSVPLRRIGEIDLRAGPDAPDWEARATRIDASAPEPGRVRVELSAREWAGRDVVLRVRVASSRGRFGEWSNAVRMKIVPPLEIPQDVTGAAAPGGVRLIWKAPPGPVYRIYRRAAAEKEPVLIGTAEGVEFIDTAARYDTPYEYRVEAFMKIGDAEALSERSAPVSVTPDDHFAPAVPSGLTVTAGAGVIQITWDPNPEADLRGYYLYRSASGGEFERTGDLLPTPYYADRAVKSGTQYRYCITAVDQKGNESARTRPGEATAQ